MQGKQEESEALPAKMNTTRSGRGREQVETVTPPPLRKKTKKTIDDMGQMQKRGKRSGERWRRGYGDSSLESLARHIW